MNTQNRKIAWFTAKIALYCAAVFGCNVLLGMWLKTYETVDLNSIGFLFAETAWAEYYEKDEPVDVLVLGSSHGLHSYRPETLKAEMNVENAVWNLSSAAQTPVTSYFMLQEVLKKNKPQLVVFDLYVMVFSSDRQLPYARYNYFGLQGGPVKDALLNEGFPLHDRVKFKYFPTYVYRKNLRVKINKLLGRQYLPPQTELYESYGYSYTPDTMSMDKLHNDNQFGKFKIDPEKLTERNFEYAEKVIETCKAAGIPIVLTTAPMPEFSIQTIENYDKITEKFNTFAAAQGVPYYDFNINRIAEVKDEYHYYDDDHMNQAGATTFSKNAAPILKKYLNRASSDSSLPARGQKESPAKTADLSAANR